MGRVLASKPAQKGTSYRPQNPEGKAERGLGRKRACRRGRRRLKRVAGWHDGPAFATGAELATQTFVPPDASGMKLF